MEDTVETPLEDAWTILQEERSRPGIETASERFYSPLDPFLDQQQTRTGGAEEGARSATGA